jgi:hypothetical protein
MGFSSAKKIRMNHEIIWHRRHVRHVQGKSLINCKLQGEMICSTGSMFLSKITNPIKLSIYTFLSMYWSTIIFS